MFGNMSNNIRTLSDVPQDSRQKCKSKGNIHTLSNKRISQSKRRKIGREPQDKIVTFNDLDIVRYNRQLLEAERKEKKGDIILNVLRKDGSRYFLHPYFNSSGSMVFINPKDPSKGFYEKNGKFCYGKTGGDTGNKLKEFKQEEIEELKIKRIMGEEDFYKRINETELDKYFGKFEQSGYTWGNANIGFDNQKEPMDSVRKKNNHISTLTHESTGIDSNNLENSGYSVINQVDTNSYSSNNSYDLFNNSYKESLESYGQPNCQNKLANQEYAKVEVISSKPDKQPNYTNEPRNQEYAKVRVISDNNNEESLEGYEKPFTETYLDKNKDKYSFYSSKPYNKVSTNLNYPYINDRKYNYL